MSIKVSLEPASCLPKKEDRDYYYGKTLVVVTGDREEMHAFQDYEVAEHFFGGYRAGLGLHPDTGEPITTKPAYTGRTCPECGGDHLEGQEITVGENPKGADEVNCAWQEITCPACQTEWTDLYELKGRIDVKLATPKTD
jgi:hypothetical protein